MSWRSLAMVFLLTGSVIAGCINAPDDGGSKPDVTAGVDHEALAELIGAPFEVEHDHRVATEPDHSGGVNLEIVNWDTLGVTLGEQGFANFVFYEGDDEELAFVAIDGDTRAGFVIVDVSDPTDLQVLGRHMIDGNSVQEVRVTSDGRYALMNVQDLPAADWVTGGRTDREDCNVCLHLIDVTDRTAPRWVDALPVDNAGTHNMHIHEIDGKDRIFYVGQPASYAFPANYPGNYVGIAEIMETPAGARLIKTGEWRDPELPNTVGRSFPHDAMVYDHPLTGAPTGYISYWDAGAVTVDFSDLARPVTLDVEATVAPSSVLSIHWFQPEPVARTDGRVIAWSAPEFDAADTDSGYIRAYDVTDPARIEQIGAWTIPGGDAMWNPGRYTFSGHTTIPDMERGLLAVTHYHAGVWILDITDPEEPRHLGYYLPNGNGTAPYEGDIWWKKPNFNPDGFLPNVYQARWKDDLLFVTERGTGMYVLEYTGPVPGPLVETARDATDAASNGA